MSARSVSLARQFVWGLRRELWEYRSIYLVPLAVGALIVLGFIFRLPSLPEDLRAAAALDANGSQQALQQPYLFSSLLLMGITALVSFAYCIDALYGERRDRSVLFWKSLPISDTMTVLTKASIPIVVIPSLTFVVTLAAHLLMTAMASLRLIGSGMSIWEQLPWAHMNWTLFHHLIVGHGFWYAPIWAWLLLCSAWSRRVPYLWATVPFLAVALLEQVAFGTRHFTAWLLHRLFGTSPVEDPHTLADITRPLGHMLASADFWIGLALAAILLTLAVLLRRHRGPN